MRVDGAKHTSRQGETRLLHEDAPPELASAAADLPLPRNKSADLAFSQLENRHLEALVQLRAKGTGEASAVTEEERKWRKEVGELYLQHQRLLAYIAWKRCGKNVSASKDLLQETLMHIVAATWAWDRVITFIRYARRVMRRTHSLMQKKGDVKRLVYTSSFVAAEDGANADRGIEADPDTNEHGAEEDVAARALYTHMASQFPEDSYARQLLRVAFEDDLLDVDEQAIALGWDEKRVYATRATIKNKGFDVLEKEGFAGLRETMKKKKQKSGDGQ